MPGRSRRWFGVALLALSAFPLISAAGDSLPRPGLADPLTIRRFRQLKQMERELVLAGEAGEERPSERARPTARGAGASRSGRVGARAAGSDPSRERTEASGVRSARRAMSARRALETVPGLVPVNLRVNDTTHDLSFAATQSEVSVAALGPRRVAAWNDGEQTEGIGFGFSSDGGRTWTDGGGLPIGNGVGAWRYDPALTVDERTGEFHVVGVILTDHATDGIGTIRGAFGDSGFRWDPPVVMRSVRDTFPDKPWIAADSTRGLMVATYTVYFSVRGSRTDQIEVQRSLDHGLTWSPPAVLSTPDERGLVQGSRPAFGPGGELYAVWKTIDTTLVAGGRDFIDVRTSGDGGASFAPRGRVADVFSNFCSGAPGSNRGYGLGYPSVAVDRGSGPHRGRVYVAWEEPLDFYDDPIGAQGEFAESEPDDTPGQATAFVPGAILDGATAAAAAGDADWFRCTLERGQTLVAFMDSIGPRPYDVSLRLTGRDGQTRLAYSAPLLIRQRALLYTAPEPGDYFLSVFPFSDSAGIFRTGSYRIVTGIVRQGAERGRDQRDVFVASSDDGSTWSEPVRVNDDPPLYDGWLPEIAVAPSGQAFVLWDDWRDSAPDACGGESTPYLARSDDGGRSWISLGPMGSARTPWTEVASNLSPNQGDYLALVADSSGVHSFWGDGRDGDPNVYSARLATPAFAARVQPEPPDFVRGAPRVHWRALDGPPFDAQVYRRTVWSDWTASGIVRADASGEMTLLDHLAEPGVRYLYRLGVPSTDGEIAAGEQAVEAPGGDTGPLAIERVQPNPGAGPIQVWLRRTSVSPATIELIDVAGRRWESRVIGPEYGHRGAVPLVAGANVPAGLYLVRLTQGSEESTARVTIIH